MLHDNHFTFYTVLLVLLINLLIPLDCCTPFCWLVVDCPQGCSIHWQNNVPTCQDLQLYYPSQGQEHHLVCQHVGSQGSATAHHLKLEIKLEIYRLIMWKNWLIMWNRQLFYFLLQTLICLTFNTTQTLTQISICIYFWWMPHT